MKRIMMEEIHECSCNKLKMCKKIPVEGVTTVIFFMSTHNKSHHKSYSTQLCPLVLLLFMAEKGFCVCSRVENVPLNMTP